MSRAKALHQVQERILSACQRAGRDPEEVTLIAVGKTFPAEVIREVYDAGQRVFGENRLQESETKTTELASLPIEWHWIGKLQTNKAAKVVECFDWIHSVDRCRLVGALEKAAAARGKPLPVLIQVNLAGEAQKGGVSPEGLESLGETAMNAPHVEPRGLMLIPPFGLPESETRRQYASLRTLSEQHRDWLAPPGNQPELSMGMTSDYEWAIEEGATFVRVGTAIFGARG